MYCQKAWVIVGLFVCAVARAEFSGDRALEYTRKAVSFGPRPPGSSALKKLQEYILGELKLRRCQIVQDDFRGQTPMGPIGMKNIIARFPGQSGRAVVFSGHYDTKSMPGRFFVGANDGGASAGFLLEMSRTLQHTAHKDDVYLVWFDGEEAFGSWSATDSLYGSRHLAERWASDNTVGRIRALINVDMIGDQDLGIFSESYSSTWLRKLVWDKATSLGFGKYFLRQSGAIEDDHIPFLEKGISALDLIDYNYGPNNSYWHTEQDTMDKLSPRSLQVVGSVLVEVLKALEG